MGTILVTGGAGFIGSHTCVELLAGGHQVVVLDNLCNSSARALERVEELSGRPLAFVRGDLRDRALLDGLLRDHPVDAVVHFAGLKAVGESTEIPLAYYSNNVHGTLVLLEAMRQAGCRRIVFSSSCTVYGDPDHPPLDENAPLGAANPYGRTKLVIEEMLRDVAAAEPGWQIALLRYFNPVGAHPSGQIGEDPLGVPNNLMPYLMQVAVGRRERLRVFGDDYPTPDGTGVRDYIHVVDLARGHLAALEGLERIEGWRAFNLGTGRGHSVLEVVAAASRAVGRQLPYEIAPRRSGDAAAIWADATRAERELGWRAERSLDEMCADSWRWQSQNPNGFAG
ncbi:MAG: UDP-glucose 4-epimerase GalE [Acidobacteria bacterium]|nr:MAG: UDP-glucose 4-epimerase GalE [Acidobacteriota bacterium]REK11261.1 MAG: UDP-glucose 4-epimerase GalE [Acidobacteriota bacterium]